MQHRSKVCRSLSLALTCGFSVLPMVSASAAVTGPVIQLTSCHLSDVRDALESVVDTGGTVQLGAGECDWSSDSGSGLDRITITMGDKDIYLRGAGATQTILKRSDATNLSYALIIICSQGEGRVELSDIGFEGNGGPTNRRERGVSLTGSCRDFKVHDMRFTKFLGSGLEIEGDDSRGVIYRSEFINNYDPASPNNGEGYGVVVYGDAGPTRTAWEPGTGEAVFIEDSYFKANRHSVASNRNSRYVVRHSTILNTSATRNTGMIDAHGAGSTDSQGSRSWEIYKNRIAYEDSIAEDSADGIATWGGDGIVWDNTFSEEIAYTFRLDGECSGDRYDYDETAHSWIWGNHREDGSPYSVIRVGNNCGSFYREGIEYILDEPAGGYHPYPYPHPLRGDASDVIFVDSFE